MAQKCATVQSLVHSLTAAHLAEVERVKQMQAHSAAMEEELLASGAAAVKGKQELLLLREELADAQRVLQAVTSTGDGLVRAVKTLLLEAQEVASAAPLEVKGVATTKSSRYSTIDQQQALLQANFEAVVMALTTSCSQGQQLCDSTKRLAEPLTTFRCAMNSAKNLLGRAEPASRAAVAMANAVTSKEATADVDKSEEEPDTAQGARLQTAGEGLAEAVGEALDMGEAAEARQGVPLAELVLPTQEGSVSDEGSGSAGVPHDDESAGDAPDSSAPSSDEGSASDGVPQHGEKPAVDGPDSSGPFDKDISECCETRQSDEAAGVMALAALNQSKLKRLRSEVSMTASGGSSSSASW